MFVSFSNAQSVGIKAGAAISNLSSNDGEISKKGARNGFTAGIYSHFPLGIFAIQPELLYTQKGGSYDLPGLTVDDRLDYLELPVALQFTLFEPLYVYAGPQVSYLIGSRTELQFGAEGEVVTREELNDFEGFDFGAVAGFGIRFDPVSIDARISKGFVDYDKERTVDGVIVQARNLQNFTFELTAGLMF